jgi:hypothetical protein
MILFIFVSALVVMQTGLTLAVGRVLAALMPDLRPVLRGLISFVFALPVVIGAALLFLIWLGEHVRSVHSVS